MKHTYAGRVWEDIQRYVECPNKAILSAAKNAGGSRAEVFYVTDFRNGWNSPEDIQISARELMRGLDLEGCATIGFFDHRAKRVKTRVHLVFV